MLGRKTGAKRAASNGTVVVSLNLGGRNLNPFEFILEGDDSEVGQWGVGMKIR